MLTGAATAPSDVPQLPATVPLSVVAGGGAWEPAPEAPRPCIAIALLLRPGETGNFELTAPGAGVYRLRLEAGVEGESRPVVAYSRPFTVL